VVAIYTCLLVIGHWSQWQRGLRHGSWILKCWECGFGTSLKAWIYVHVVLFCVVRGLAVG
jgi:hypothetical protein